MAISGANLRPDPCPEISPGDSRVSVVRLFVVAMKYSRNEAGSSWV